MDSILRNVRKKVCGNSDCDCFDEELIDDINACLRRLNELGIGILNFNVTGDNETWEDFCGEYYEYLTQIKRYVHLKVRLMFDPPNASYLITHMEKEINEIEWNLESDIESLYN